MPSAEDPRGAADTECFICVACGTQFAAAPAPAPPEGCPICQDQRQYVPPDGQRWTTLAELRAKHKNRIAPQGELAGILTEPHFAIGQRALLVPFGESQLMWDCVALLDDASADEVDRRGGLRGIAVSHPHYYTAIVEWAQRFDCPIYLHADDARWIMRPDDSIELWRGDSLALGDGLTLVRCGGHFPGATVLHWEGAAGGRGALLVGDVVSPVADRRYVTFMWSYPNYVPLPAQEIRRIGRALAPLRYEALHGAFWDTERSDAKAMVDRSLRRYLRVLESPEGLVETPSDDWIL
jgi:glyoxylase-like metal-dependent hydrolase (beta-lactamase superfamily II)